MLEASLILACGLATIYFGGRWLMEGASQLAASLGVRPFVIGLTIVGIGTSTPELALSILANLEQEGPVSLGNVIGANIGNMSYILGASALIAPIAVRFSIIRREGMAAIGSILLLVALVAVGGLEWWGGLLMLVGFAVFICVFLLTLQKCDPGNDVTCQFEDLGADLWSRRRAFLTLLLGILLLVLGAQATVSGAVDIASGLGVDEVLIGITIVSVGTCLPELTIAIFSALKRRPDLAMGNALGTIAFNTLVVLGTGALVSGRLDVPASVLLSGLLPMLGVVLVPVVLIQRKGRLGRGAGAMMVTIYAGYLAFLLLFN